MKKLERADLLSLEQYSEQRSRIRAEAIAHKKNRHIALGEHIRLLFEDRLTIRYQIQEMLRIEKIFEAAAIKDELDAYNPLIPDGDNLKATMLIEYEDVEERKAALEKLRGIEDVVFAQIGAEKIVAVADEDMERENATKTASVHFLRFPFNATLIQQLRAGAALSFGVDHPQCTIGVAVSDDQHKALLADFD